ncbi:hypothetical protein IE077_001536 [Cardiosporidium cionae]|uniref:Fe2OG dioxygenase domain-containing protein n=1 Tax=Cardiosporidium cionae TaxID=476202 RepID=A0ABQ7JCN4_9APIC|nr:hypothetical protein IE077_001536 [Cardiosporidium cionae]|eukprot:KAF8821798.1 hypothetical protein IE077_001536 [Cardiosporidium cionae]
MASIDATQHGIRKGRWRKDKRCRDDSTNSVLPLTISSPVEAKNIIGEIALQSIRRSPTFLVDADASSAVCSVLRSSSLYLPSFFASQQDYTIYSKLLHELLDVDLNEKVNDFQDAVSISKRDQLIPVTPVQISENVKSINSSRILLTDPAVPTIPEHKLTAWSRHCIHENPQFSPTFRFILDQLEKYFDVEIFASRLNLYRNGSDWKPFHHDSHAYSKDHKQAEDFTMGASFGASRELVFLHEPSSHHLSIPQNNGDVFAFASDVNRKLKHGVPQLPKGKVGPRFSVIAWGKRRSLNPRNAGTSEINQTL